jgi:3-dehydroquinate synthase
MVVSYEVEVSPGLLDPANGALADAGAGVPPVRSRRLVVVDANVHHRYGVRLSKYFNARGIEHAFCVIDAHERAKTMDSVFEVVSSMDRFGLARRQEPVIAVGGGVLTDVVGLATSLYRRSTPYVKVPTTLIGMVDAGIGAKTGVNFERHKNRLGSYHPSLVALIDPEFLATLSTRHIRNGFAEVLKIALIKDRHLLDLLAEHGSRLIAERLQPADGPGTGPIAGEVLRRAIHGMLQELQPNLWEHQLKRLVDYGHSFSPAMEMEALPELLHGEAVSVDMALTTLIAHHRGLVSAADVKYIWRVMDQLDLPRWHPVCTPDLLARALDDTVRHRDGRQLLPLPVGVGSACFVDDVSRSELARACAELQQLSWARSGTGRSGAASAAVGGGGHG